ncbi:MAG: hypothetical protein OXC18_18165 [Desulfurellaceae bacterium]|nr:hypothetical protein [Desulfurellaceae bacterium]
MEILKLFVQFLTLLAITGSGYFVYQQLAVMNRHATIANKQAEAANKQAELTAKQDALNRIVATKASIQEVNKLIFQYPDFFIPLLYPQLVKEHGEKKGIEQGKQLTSAYTSLNALETLYHMRTAGREKEDPVLDEVRGFIRAYIRADNTIAELWRQKPYRAAFHENFQTEVTDALITVLGEDAVER